MSVAASTVRDMTTLFPDLPPELPAGSLVLPDPADAPPGRENVPLLWLSDASVADPAASWSALWDARERTGLWPLLVGGLSEQSLADYWMLPTAPETIERQDPDDARAGLWDSINASDEDEDDLEWDDGVPHNDPWPGLAVTGVPVGDPDAVAEWYVQEILGSRIPWRLGLVPVERSADVLARTGWSGPCNHTNATNELSAVLRSWEDRFGARVVAIELATLHVSVAAPPQDLDHARAVALEHFAFCPDNIWQSDTNTLDRYAETLIGVNTWTFWWD
jgi:hypothetical protein